MQFNTVLKRYCDNDRMVKYVHWNHSKRLVIVYNYTILFFNKPNNENVIGEEMTSRTINFKPNHILSYFKIPRLHKTGNYHTSALSNFPLPLQSETSHASLTHLKDWVVPEDHESRVLDYLHENLTTISLVILEKHGNCGYWSANNRTIERSWDWCLHSARNVSI